MRYMKRDYIFLSCVGILFIILIGSLFVQGENQQSIIENRSLYDFPEFSIEKFMNNSYQSDLEVAMTDQIIYGEQIKLFYNSVKNNNLNTVVSVLKEFENSNPTLASGTNGSPNHDEMSKSHGDFKKASSDLETFEELERQREKRLEQERMAQIQALIDEGRHPGNLTFEANIRPKGSGYFQLDDSGHLIVRKRTLDDANALFESKVNNYNELVKSYPELSYYSYYIETDVDIDFINGTIDHELVNGFFGQLDPAVKTAALYINKPSDFAKYFYKTDHHWDTEGQLKGYKDIIHLLKGEDEETLDIEKHLIEGVVYNGSKSRTISDFNTIDEFTLLTSDLAEHKVFINGEKSRYGAKSAYLNGRYSKEKGVNHYGIANGGDFGLVEYRFNQPDRDNILIFVESFSNPINEFIASHLDNTYLVDLRYYAGAFNRNFDFGDFIEEHDIEHVLFIGYYFFYANDAFLIKD